MNASLRRRIDAIHARTATTKYSVNEADLDRQVHMMSRCLGLAEPVIECAACTTYAQELIAAVEADVTDQRTPPLITPRCWDTHD